MKDFKLRILKIALIFFLIMTVFFLFAVNETTKRTNSILVKERETLEKKIESLSVRAKQIEKEKNDLAAKMSDYEKKLEVTTAEVERLLSETRTKGDELTLKNAEMATLKKMIKEYEAKLERLNKRLAWMPKWGKKKEEEESVTLEPITVTQKGKKSTVKVMEVNKDYGFLVINIGSEQGIKKGDALFVFRNKVLLGTIIVEKAGDGVSIAKVLYKSLADVVRKGDLVSY